MVVVVTSVPAAVGLAISSSPVKVTKGPCRFLVLKKPGLDRFWLHVYEQH